MDVLGVRHIIDCGHTDCGAMKGVLYPDKVAHLPAVRTWLNHGEVARRVVEGRYGDLPEDQKLAALIESNVVAQIAHLQTHPSVAARLARGELCLHGWVYDIGSGQITVWDSSKSAFVPVQEYRVDAEESRPVLQHAS